MRLIGLFVLALTAIGASVYAYLFFYRPELLPADVYVFTAKVLQRTEQPIEQLAPVCKRNDAALVALPLAEPILDSTAAAKTVVLPRNLPERFDDAPLLSPNHFSRWHLLNDIVRIRTPDAELIWPDAVSVSVAIDENGRVAGVVPVFGPERFYAQAVAIAQRWRFEPFLRDGKPVAVRIERIDVPIVGAERRPRTRIAMPAVADWSSLRITLRGIEYLVSIQGDGTVTYASAPVFQYTSGMPETVHCAVISPEAVRHLVEQFRRADFYWTHDRYEYDAIHANYAEVAITFDGQSKGVVDFAGVWAGIPEALLQLEAAIAETAGVDRWHRGNALTGKTLAAERWNVAADTAHNRALLMIAIENGSVDAVRDLLAMDAFVSTEWHSGMEGNQLVRERPLVSALVAAARRRDPAFSQLLLGTRVKWEQAALDAALLERASLGDVALMHALLARGARPMPDREKGTLVMRAAQSGVPDAVALAMAHDVALTDASQGTVLHMVAYGPDDEPESLRVDRRGVIEMLVRAGAAIEARDQFGRTPLISSGNDVDVTQALLDAGADVNARDDTGDTALMLARRPEVARLLLEAGADPLLRNDEGGNAITVSTKYERFDVTRMLLRTGIAWDKTLSGQAVYEAARRSEAALVGELIAAGIDVNARAGEQRTPLIGAALSGKPEIVAQILALRPAVNAVDEAGMSALHFAGGPHLDGAQTGDGWRGSVELLLNAGANLHAHDVSGRTAMGLCPVTDVMHLLAARGADVNTRDSHRKTPLMECAMRANDFKADYLARVRALLALGADVHARSDDGDSALAIAKRAEAAELVTLLEAWIAAHPPPAAR